MNKIRRQYFTKLLKDNNGSHFINNKDEYIKRLKTPYFNNECFYDQIDSGDGGEITSEKFFKINSSSRLCFELYSCLVNLPNVCDVQLEYKLTPLNGINSKTKQPFTPANMDAFIKSSDNQIFLIESKYLETSLNNLGLGLSYYKVADEKLVKLYRLEDNANKNVILNLIKTFGNDTEAILNKYKGTENYFDVRQEFTHIMGITLSLIAGNPDFISSKIINFYNIIYRFESSSIVADEFLAVARIYLRNLLDALRLDIKVNYDVLFIQDIIKNPQYPLDLHGFSSKKTVKELLKPFNL